MSFELAPGPNKKRGFAAISPERRREIASLGGRAAHLSGHAHQFNSEEASLAGKLRHLKAIERTSAATQQPQ